jgi:hypothetical protein
MSKPFANYNDVQEIREKLKETSYEHWIHDDVFTWKWWLLLSLTIVPWFIWWRVVDKKGLNEILLYGAFIAISAIILDNIGTDLLWWGYPTKLFQMVPPLFPADITLVPCLMMLVYQWTKTWKSFLLSNFILSLFMAYIGESLFIWLDLYELNEWKLTYSLLFYNIGGIIFRWIVIKIKSFQQKVP